MNILVTGANGFLGKALMNYLSGDGNTVRGIYSKELPIHGSGYICDLTSDDSVTKIQSALKEEKWDSLVHLASVLCNDSVGAREVLETNLKMSWNILALTRSIRPRQLIHTSSIAVYPNLSGCFSENSPVRPSANAEGLYGLSKICAENIFDHQLRGSGTTVINLRLAQVWGEGMRSDRIFEIMRDELKQTGKISVFGNGERVSNFIHIDRLVEDLSLVIGEEVEEGVYNVGDKSVSYLELAKRVAMSEGADHSVIELLGPGSRARFELDFSKFTQVLSGLRSQQSVRK